MNSGHGVRTMSASKRVSGEPLGVYMGNTTRCSMPSALDSSGRKSASEGPKSGLPKPSSAQRRRSSTTWAR